MQHSHSAMGINQHLLRFRLQTTRPLPRWGGVVVTTGGKSSPSYKNGKKARKPAGKRRGRRKNPWTTAVPAAFGVLMVIALIYIFNRTVSKLEGELEGTFVTSGVMSPRRIEKHVIPMSVNVVDEAIRGLSSTPLTIQTGLMEVEIKGAGSGFQIGVRETDRTTVVRVNVRTHTALMDYVRTNVREWETRRDSALKKAAADFVTEWKKSKENRMSLGNLPKHRDEFAFGTTTGALGYHVVAIDNAANYEYRCVYEDDEGYLYFIIPTGVTEIEILGRRFGDDDQPFIGRFKVTVGQGAPASNPGTGTSLNNPGGGQPSFTIPGGSSPQLNPFPDPNNPMTQNPGINLPPPATSPGIQPPTNNPDMNNPNMQQPGTTNDGLGVLSDGNSDMQNPDMNNPDMQKSSSSSNGTSGNGNMQNPGESPNGDTTTNGGLGIFGGGDQNSSKPENSNPQNPDMQQPGVTNGGLGVLGGGNPNANMQLPGSTTTDRSSGVTKEQESGLFFPNGQPKPKPMMQPGTPPSDATQPDDGKSTLIR